MRTIIALLIASCCLPAFGQGETSPIFLPRTLQSNILNPAMNDGSKVAIGLPSTNLMLVHDGFTFNDLVQPVPGQPDSSYLAIDQFVSQLGENGTFKAEARADWLSLAIGGKRVRILAGISNRSLSEFSYPVDLLRLAWNGNAPYLDETLELAPAFRTMNWLEAGVGAQVGIGKRITVAGRVKYLGGLLYASSTSSQADMTTASDGYDITFDVDYQVEMSWPGVSQINWASLESIQNSQPQINVTGLGNNRGIGGDLGITFRPTSTIEIGASALDLGQIVWRDNTTTLSVKGDFTFSGINVSPFFKGDSVGVTALADSLLSGFSFLENDEPIRTALPTRYVIHGAWEPLNWLRLQTAIQAQQFLGRPDLSWALGAQLKAGKWLDFGASYMYRPDARSLIGVQSSLKLGPVVLYAMSDHAISLLDWKNSRMIHVRFGMNFQIGSQTPLEGISEPARTLE